MQVIIMRGLPGSGKSTYARKFVEYMDRPGRGVIVSADDYFVVEGEYRFDRSRIQNAHNYCLGEFVSRISWDAMQDALIVDNTNVHAWEIAPYYRLAEYYKASVKIVTMRTCLEECLKRQTHGVPEVTMGMMHANLSREVLPLHWKQEYAGSIV